MNSQINIPLIDVESEHCALIVDKGLEQVKGVKNHKVEFNNRKAIVEIDETMEGVLNNVITKIRSLGYNAETLTKTFPVTGMTCASCAISVESMLKAQKGVVKAAVNIAANTVLVEYIPTETYPEKLKAVIQSIGYDLIIDSPEKAKKELEELRTHHFSQLRFKTIASVILSIPLVIIGMFYMHSEYSNYLMWALSTPVIFIFGRQFFINAFKQARNRTANMDTLVALSTGVAYIFSVFNTLFPQYWHSRGLHADVYFEAAAVVIAFILIGKMLEDRAKSNTSSAIKKLMGLQPDQVILIEKDGSEKIIRAAEIKKQDMLLVKPGERIPVDGSVFDGASNIDESSITGEPIPAEKKKGDKVFAGTINQKGTLTILAEKVGSETVLAQIIKMVQEAQGSKAPVQKLVDKIAGVFVPVVMGISVLTFILWMLLGGENAFTHAMLSTVTVLVIACPCALGLATPTAIMVGIGKAAEHGILIKDAESLELAKKINAIILDKTGTITQGKPSVTDFHWMNKDNSDQLQKILYSIEKRSEHPLADAVVAYLEKTETVTLDAFESVTGKGARAKVDGHLYFVGNKKLLNENNITIPANDQLTAESFLKDAKTVVYFASNERLLAIIAISDQIKETSKEAVTQLKENGIEVYMLTGDNAQTAAAVSTAVGIDHFKAEVLPSDKADFIKELQAKGKIVAMVGDGINDSHALAQANVSIAMGKGSDIAMDVAKMTIISSDLMLIPKAIKLSKQTVRVIKQNLFWAFIYNIIGIPLAAGLLYPINGFLLNPMIAGAAMALSSVSVVGNSLLLKMKKI
ncbi:MAG TPA: heavy metal translocating P-type ATPase [Flavobacteriales bacterium]|nr:heavy metal translocating P-type ATPase [Flavobacteriales bacterium]